MQKPVNLNSLREISHDLKVLYIEDNAEVRESTNKFLLKFFLHVDLANDGQEGLEKYKEYAKKENKYYDIILSDINMPRLNGVRMCKAIKEINPTQKIVIISAHEDKNYLLDMLDIGVDGFLAKPFDMLKAVEILNKICLTFQSDNVQYFKALTNATTIIKLDTEGTIIYANENFCTVTGYSKDELVGQSHKILAHEEDPKTIFEQIQDNKLPSVVNKRQIIQKKKDGSKFIADTTVLPLFDNHGEIIEYMVIKDDITQVVELKEQLFQKEQEQIIQQKIEKAKESFLLIFTHELKTPLNAIINFSQYIKKKIEISSIENREKLNALSETVLENATDMLSTVTQILEISKLTSNKLQYTKETFSVNKVLFKLIDKFDAILNGKSIELTITNSEEFFVHSDKHRVEQIISNVVSNATKYGRNKINISLQVKDKELQLCIEDNGNGIKNKENVFDLYTQEQENTLERKGTGTGIGLYFVKLICEDLDIGYKIEDSQNLSGINFIFTFKAAR